MGRAWRLLVGGSASGWWNMALDEVLLASVAAGAPPAVRFYRWRGPWLSLGYAQLFDPERRRACERAGVRVVRRITGGAAVLHGADLTYAVVAPEEWIPGGLAACYAWVAEWLLRALRGLGLEAKALPLPEGRAPRPRRDFDCFAAAAGGEICAGGRKLVGSAQRRLPGAWLQHGSIRLRPDPPSARRAAGLGPGATSLAELGLPCGPGARRLIRALVEGLRLEVGGGLSEEGLLPEERAALRACARALRRAPLARRSVSWRGFSRASADGR